MVGWTASFSLCVCLYLFLSSLTHSLPTYLQGSQKQDFLRSDNCKNKNKNNCYYYFYHHCYYYHYYTRQQNSL